MDARGEGRVRQWMQDYGGALRRICYAYLSDFALAEDAVQEALFRAWRAGDQFEGRNGSSERTWLTRIAINVCKDLRRSSWWRIRSASRAPEELCEGRLCATPQDRDLFIDILRLPEAYREVVLLYYYQRMTQQEVAEVLGISRSLVNYRLHRALDQLKVPGEELARCGQRDAGED